MNKKQLIHESGIKLISRDGFSNTKVNSIVLDANLSVGTFYNYFKDKNDLLKYIYKEEGIRQCALLKSILESTKTSREKIETYIDFIINQGIDEIYLVNLIHNEKSVLSRILLNANDNELDNLFSDYQNLFFELLDNGKKDNIIKNTSNKLILTLMLSLTTSVVQERISNISTTPVYELRGFIYNIIFLDK